MQRLARAPVQRPKDRRAAQDVQRAGGDHQDAHGHGRPVVPVGGLAVDAPSAQAGPHGGAEFGAPRQQRVEPRNPQLGRVVRLSAHDARGDELQVLLIFGL